MCGVLAGGVATWNTALDAAFAFQQLIDPSVQVTGITEPVGQPARAPRPRPLPPRRPPQGRARLALAAALGDTPGWFTPLSPEPAADRLRQPGGEPVPVGRQGGLPVRLRVPRRARGARGRQPVVEHRRRLLRASCAKSADLPRGTRAVPGRRAEPARRPADAEQGEPGSRADPAAVRYLASNISFTGQISIPVLTMHTTGDGLVIPQNEQAYASVGRRAGRSFLLRQVFVSRAGHCAFTPAETITSVRILLHRLRTGHWNDAALAPARMNAAAAALGPNYNIFVSGGNVVPVAPAFTAFQPTLYPRPFDLGGFFRRAAPKTKQ